MERLVGKENASRLRTFLTNSNAHKASWAVVGLLAVIAVVVGALLVFLTPVGGVAALVAGMGALLILRDVRWGLFVLLAIICLLPFASLPFKVGFTPTFLDLAFGALYAVWGMRLVTRRQDDFVLTPLGIPVLVFTALALFSFVLGLSHSRPSMNDLRSFAEVLMGFGIFFLVVNCVRQESLLRQVTAVMILAAAAESAIGVALYVVPTTWAVSFLSPLGRLGYPVGFGALRFINDDPDRPMRAIGTSVDPNILGALLVVLLVIAATQLFAKRPVLPRTWLALSIGVMSICLFLTYSRASMAGAVLAVGMVALLKYRRLFIVLAIGGLLMLLLPQTQAYILHSIQGIRGEERSTQMRVGEYEDTFKLIQRYPWLGVGFVGTPDIDLYVGVASLYLALAAQMGIVGLLSFLLVMTVFFVHWFYAWRKLDVHAPRPQYPVAPQETGLEAVTNGSGGRAITPGSATGETPHAALEPFLLGYGAAVFGSLASGVLDHTLLTYPHAVALLWLTLGLGTATARMIGHHSRLP